MFKSGFISIVGRPNTGKSTLLNALVGEKVAIISQKPQTTRNKIQGVLTEPENQIVFIDTPGIHRPKHKLGEALVKAARSSLSEVDGALLLVSAHDGLTSDDELAISCLKAVKAPVILVINKIDAIIKTSILEITKKANEIRTFTHTVPISAKTGENLDVLLGEIRKLLPEGPKYFPDDYVTDQPERFIAAEIIREKLLKNLRDEIPHGTAVEILSMKKRDNRELVDVEAQIYCEKESHKGIVIGKNGDVLKRVGSEARLEIERLLGSSVNLNLWVKVKNDWRDNELLIRQIVGTK